MNLKGKFKDLFWITIAVVALQLVLSGFIYPMIPGVGVTQNLFSITPQTAITSPTIGNSLLGVLAGIIPFDLGNFTHWIVLFLSGFALVFAGYFVYDKFSFLPKGKNVYEKIWFVLLYGTALLWAILVLFKMSNFSTIALPLVIGLGLNYVVISLVVTQLAKTKFGSKFLRI